MGIISGELCYLYTQRQRKRVHVNKYMFSNVYERSIHINSCEAGILNSGFVTKIFIALKSEYLNLEEKDF